MMKKILLGVGFLGCVAVAGFIIFQTPWVSTFFLRQYLSSREGVVLEHVSMASQRFDFPGHFHWEDVNITLRRQQQKLVISAPAVDITGVQQWFGREKRLMVDAMKAQLQYDVGILKDLNVHVTVTPSGVSGSLEALNGRWDKWELGDLSAFVILTDRGMEMRAIKCLAYDGYLTGKLTLHEGVGLVVYAGEVFVDGLNVVRLKDINRAVVDQIDGVVSGTVRFQGDAQRLHALDVAVDMPQGGNMNAALLAVLTQYLPASREKKRLDMLIRRGGKLGMEFVSFTLKGGEAGHFSGQLHLRSREINLELNLTHELNTDGTLASLLASGSKFIQ